MATTKKAPTGATKKDTAGITDTDGADTEGHGSRKLDTAAVSTDQPGTGPEDATRRLGDESEDDVEGHNYAPNAMLSSNAAQSREREIQRNLKAHDTKSSAKRPFFKKG